MGDTRTPMSFEPEPGFAPDGTELALPSHIEKAMRVEFDDMRQSSDAASRRMERRWRKVLSICALIGAGVAAILAGRDSSRQSIDVDLVRRNSPVVQRVYPPVEMDMFAKIDAEQLRKSPPKKVQNPPPPVVKARVDGAAPKGKIEGKGRGRVAVSDSAPRPARSAPAVAARAAEPAPETTDDVTAGLTIFRGNPLSRRECERRYRDLKYPASVVNQFCQEHDGKCDRDRPLSLENCDMDIARVSAQGLTTEECIRRYKPSYPVDEVRAWCKENASSCSGINRNRFDVPIPATAKTVYWNCDGVAAKELSGRDGSDYSGTSMGWEPDPPYSPAPRVRYDGSDIPRIYR